MIALHRDFHPTTYATPDGSLRVVRVGVLWYGEARDPDTGRWVEHAAHCASHPMAIAQLLVALGHEHPDDVEAHEYECDGPAPGDSLGW